MALAIFGLEWTDGASDRDPARNAVATNAVVAVDAKTHAQHGQYCYSYLVGAGPGRPFSGCGSDRHTPEGDEPPVGAAVSIIYDRRHPGVSCICTPDYLLYIQPANDLFWAFVWGGLVVLLLVVVFVRPSLPRIEAALSARRRQAVP